MGVKMTRWIVSLAIATMFLAASGQAQADKFAKLMLKKADKAFDKRVNAAKAKKSKELYEKVLAVDSGNYEARWKLGRLLYWIGTHVKTDKEKMKIFEEGIRYCQEAIKLKDDCVECHFWLGVSYGKYGEAKGILQSLGLVPHLKEAMNKAYKLDKTTNWGGPDRVLGRLFHQLPGIKGGDNSKAIEHYKAAIKISPQHLMNHRFLAEVLLDEGKKDEAKASLKFILDMPQGSFIKDVAPEMAEEKEKAQKLWDKNFK